VQGFDSRVPSFRGNILYSTTFIIISLAHRQFLDRKEIFRSAILDRAAYGLEESGCVFLKLTKSYSGPAFCCSLNLLGFWIVHQ
jgi:hypothetical protein